MERFARMHDGVPPAMRVIEQTPVAVQPSPQHVPEEPAYLAALLDDDSFVPEP
jgi:hypothetical protein